MLLDIIFWVIFGGIAGLIASSLAGEGARVNGFMNVVVGVIGALIGGFVFSALGGQGVTGFNIYSFLVAVIGSVLLLWIVRLARR
ncbi:MAG: Transglycosylase associated protein [Candidatus Uhrbacteria bacterium GW2011_GWA2_53_10]|uniref:Transglycosylase associated protein n=1 Tax=Candidatus Uhrbacteria bacterium GW2011_GWA2_53_10 TaxID=1618980 RepID=A0A0G1XPD4_9BACT|nr:MAG: Transglycosylase associated protein [Candidatus Uhrbacteria bacterium GW2011_GWA2_53_10]